MFNVTIFSQGELTFIIANLFFVNDIQITLLWHFTILKVWCLLLMLLICAICSRWGWSSVVIDVPYSMTIKFQSQWPWSSIVTFSSNCFLQPTLISFHVLSLRGVQKELSGFSDIFSAFSVTYSQWYISLHILSVLKLGLF